MAKGKGVIIVTGHFGNWEIMPITLKIKGYPGAVVGRRIYFEKYDRYLNSLRAYHGVNIIYRDESPRKILKIIRSGGIVGIVADQDVDSVEGVFVDFLGREAYTPAGPAALAKVTGAALIPAFMIRQGSKHRLIFDRPIELVDTGDKDKDLITNTQAWSDVVASYIRKYPDQWVWMHRRWKTKAS
jgi:KDO2-lipid IV(A) lauroyltransferase